MNQQVLQKNAIENFYILSVVEVIPSILKQLGDKKEIEADSFENKHVPADLINRMEVVELDRGRQDTEPFDDEYEGKECTRMLLRCL